MQSEVKGTKRAVTTELVIDNDNELKKREDFSEAVIPWERRWMEY